MNKLFVLIVTLFLSLSVSSYAQATGESKQQDMLALLDMLDQIDEMDFQDEIDKANSCISLRNYSCARKHIENSKQFANDQYQQEQLELVRKFLKDEIKADQEAKALAKKREKERQQEARRQREREIARRRAEEQRRQDRADAEFRKQMITSLVSGLQEVAETNARITEENNRLIQDAYEMKRRQNEAEEERRRQAAYEAKLQAERDQQRRQEAYAAQQRAKEAKQRAREREQKLAQQQAEKARREQAAREARRQQEQTKQQEALARKKAEQARQKQSVVSSGQSRQPVDFSAKLKGYSLHGSSGGVSLYYKVDAFGIAFRVTNSTDDTVHVIVKGVTAGWTDGKNRTKDVTVTYVNPGKVSTERYDHADNYSKMKEWSFKSWRWTDRYNEL